MSQKTTRKHSRAKRILMLLFIKIPAAFFAVTVLWVLVYKWCPVKWTPLMCQRKIENIGNKDFKIRQKWVPYSNVSGYAGMAAIASEDELFLEHDGFNWDQITDRVLEYKAGRADKISGISSISMQTAKNAFLLPVRSYIRVGLEAYFTVLIEKIWGKKRILEVYLNIAEMGDGIFGIEEASRHFFQKSPAQLDAREASLLCATLPNPSIYSPVAESRANGYCVGDRSRRVRQYMGTYDYPDWVRNGK